MTPALALTIFIVGTLVFGGGLVLWAYLSWRRRWQVPELGGIPVRFDRGAVPTPALKAEIAIANATLKEVLAANLLDTPDRQRFYVEVVPLGEVRTPTIPHGRFREKDGSVSTAGGSYRVERYANMFGEPKWVAVVVDERTSGFIAHEVCRHIMPDKKGFGADANHDLKAFESLEKTAKALIAAALSRAREVST